MRDRKQVDWGGMGIGKELGGEVIIRIFCVRKKSKFSIKEKIKRNLCLLINYQVSSILSKTRKG